MAFIHRHKQRKLCIRISCCPYLHQLHEVLKVLLLINGQLAVVVDDAVVLHFAVTADAQGVIPRIVGAFPHQEQTRLWGVEKPLGLFSSNLAMKPAGEKPGKMGKKDQKKEGIQKQREITS